MFKFKKYAGKLAVIDCGSLITIEADTPIIFELELADAQALRIEISFKRDSTGEKELMRSFNEDDSTVMIVCTNFDNPLGTGTAEPVRIFTYKGQAVYLHFWSFLLGDTGLKRIDYTFYQE